MRSLLFLASFLATAFVVGGTHIDGLESCGKKTLYPEYVDVNPFPVKSGREVAIDVPIDSGRFSFPKTCA